MVQEMEAVTQYRVLARNLSLLGVKDPPEAFWVVKRVGDRVLIESGEEDSYWIRAEELERALTLGWVQPVQ